MELILQRLALSSYGIATILAFCSLVLKRRIIMRLVPLFAAGGVLFHLAAVIPGVLAGEHLPLNSIDDVLPFLTVVAVGVYLYGHWRHGLHVLGVILLPLALILNLVSGVLPARTVPLSAGLKDPLLAFHIAVSSLGMGALFLTFTFSLIYLYQERALKTKRSGHSFFVLPALSTCDKVLHVSLVIGFGLLTVGLAAAAIWSANFRGTFHLWNNQGEVIGLISWAIFALVLYTRLVRGWQGRKAALLSIAGFTAVMVRLLSYPLF